MTSKEGKAVMQRLDQEMVPVVLIIEIVRENNVFDIKFMLEGENLVHDDGREFRLFLKQSKPIIEEKKE